MTSKLHLYHNDQDTRMPKKALVDLHKQVRQDCGVTFIPKVEKQRLRNQLDPSMQRYLEWLSTDSAEYFAEERPQPTSSSSWTPISSWWTSSSRTSEWHQHEWQDSALSEKWQDETTSTLISRSRSWLQETRSTISNTKSEVVDMNACRRLNIFLSQISTNEKP